MSAVEKTDAELVSRSVAGNRDAFGQIVKRYQTLICSLAYSATGSLPQSEDLSQETFVTAWKQLPELNEPAKLRPWLCGIVRNLIRRTFRQLTREPAHAAESLEAAQESPALEPLPADQAVTREEEAIMWRSLERIPEIYREPLVLFYREHQSVERVAEELELSEDAVKQRLSRGRKLLHEQVRMFVETALRKSAPGTAFSLAVVAALPVAMTQTAKALLIMCAAVLISLQTAHAQGCIVARSNGQAGGPESEGGYLMPGEWNIGIGYRHQFSFRHFVGDVEQTYRIQQGTQVMNKINLLKW